VAQWRWGALVLHKQTADSKHTSSKTGAHLMQVRVTLPCGPGDDCECRLKVALLYSPRHWQGAGRQPLAARWRWWCWPTCSSWCVLRCSALYVPLLLRGTRQSVGTCAVWHPLVVCAAALSSATLFQPRPPADTACAALPPLLLPSPPCPLPSLVDTTPSSGHTPLPDRIVGARDTRMRISPTVSSKQRVRPLLHCCSAVPHSGPLHPVCNPRPPYTICACLLRS